MNSLNIGAFKVDGETSEADGLVLTIQTPDGKFVDIHVDANLAVTGWG